MSISNNIFLSACSICFLIIGLNISHNGISSLPDDIINCSCLTSLDLSYNAFTSLPNLVLKVDALTSVDASHNHIMGK